jgi:hypothetical protein
MSVQEVVKGDGGSECCDVDAAEGVVDEDYLFERWNGGGFDGSS